MLINSEQVSNPGFPSGLRPKLSGSILKAKRQNESSTRASTLFPTHEANRQRRTVLVVEDEPGVRAATSEFLACCGYNVLAANDGLDGLWVSEAHMDSIEVLVTDISLPKITGLELAAAMVAKRPELRVIFTSGHDLDAFEVRAPLAKCALLQKPFSLTELASEVERALRTMRK